MLSNPGEKDAVMEAVVLVLTGAEGLDKALASQRASPRSWSSINAPNSNGRMVPDTEAATRPSVDDVTCFKQWLRQEVGIVFLFSWTLHQTCVIIFP